MVCLNFCRVYHKGEKWTIQEIATGAKAEEVDQVIEVW